MEFLIRRSDGDWFSLARADFSVALRPTNFASAPCEGWGDHRIKLSNGTIAFSYEDPGIQVIFKDFSGNADEVRQIVEEILANIEFVTRQKGSIVEL